MSRHNPDHNNQPTGKIRFGISDEPSPKLSLIDNFGKVCGVAEEAAKMTVKAVTYLTRAFVNSVGPVSAAGILALALGAGVGVVMVKDKVNEIFNLKFTHTK